MKRKKYIFIACSFALFITGCSKNTVSEETTAQTYNAEIENPSINIQNKNDSVDTIASYYTNFVIKDKYKVYTLTEKTESNDIAVPDWQPKDGMVIDVADMLNDMDDKMRKEGNTTKRIDFLRTKLKPNGMYIEKYGLQAMFLGYKPPYVKEYASDVFADTGRETESIKTTGMWDYLIYNNVKTVKKYDVFCISLNMYEGFYNNSNTTKVTIYGIPEETFENNLKETENFDNNPKFKSYTYPDISAISEKYHNGECRLDILADVELIESGNYYMDFTKIIADDEYKDMIMEIETTGEITDEYTYIRYGFGYKMDNEQVYSSWKAQNLEKFIYQ